MRTLSVENLILFHDKIIKQTGGSLGIRDKGLIESALNRAFMTYDGKDLYPKAIDKIELQHIALLATTDSLMGIKELE